MLLAIDVGNTNTVLGIFDGKVLVRSWRVKTDPRNTSDELWLQFGTLVADFEISGLAVCSTVPATLREMRTMINSYFPDIRTTIVEPGIKTVVPLLVDNPNEIGADRIVHLILGDAAKQDKVTTQLAALRLKYPGAARATSKTRFGAGCRVRGEPSTATAQCAAVLG